MIEHRAAAAKYSSGTRTWDMGPWRPPSPWFARAAGPCVAHDLAHGRRREYYLCEQVNGHLLTLTFWWVWENRLRPRMRGPAHMPPFLSHQPPLEPKQFLKWGKCEVPRFGERIASYL